MTFDIAMKLGDWVPIRDCPGRFVLRGVPCTLSVASLLGEGVRMQTFHSPVARDTVFVASFEGGGTISYGSLLTRGFTHYARRMASAESSNSYKLHCMNKAKQVLWSALAMSNLYS